MMMDKKWIKDMVNYHREHKTFKLGFYYDMRRVLRMNIIKDMYDY